MCVCELYSNYLFYFDGHHLRQIENQTNVRSLVSSMTIYVLMGDGGFGMGNEDEDEDDVFVEIVKSGYLEKLEMSRKSKHIIKTCTLKYVHHQEPTNHLERTCKLLPVASDSKATALHLGGNSGTARDKGQVGMDGAREF